MIDSSNENFDRLLREQLKSRPEPVPSFDLAARALALAKRRSASPRTAGHGAEIALHARWFQSAQLAASILIVLILFYGGKQLWAVEKQWSADSASTTASQTTSEVSDSSTSAGADSIESSAESSTESSTETSGLFGVDLSGSEGLMILGVVLAGGVAVCLAAVRSLGGNDLDSQFSPTGMVG
jgi:hypothetical protein